MTEITRRTSLALQLRHQGIDVMQPSSDPLATLRQLVLDRSAPISDVLRAVVMLADSTHGTELRAWALAELNGYPKINTVPEYRKVRAPIVEQIQVFSAPTTRPFNVDSVPYQLREYFTDIVPLNQGVDALESLVNDFEAQHSPIGIEHYASYPYVAIRNKRPGRPYTLLGLYWSLSPSLVRGVLGQIRSHVVELVSDLRTEVGAGDGLPTAEQTAHALRDVIGTANFTSSVNIFAGVNQTGDIVSNQPEHQYNFGDVQGNVAAGSRNFTQVYQETFDVSKVRQFTDLIAEISGMLQLEADQRAALEVGAIELRAAADDPAADRGRMRRALDAVMTQLKLAGSSALQNTAIALGTALGTDLGTHLPHL